MGAPKQPSQITQTNEQKLGPEQKKVFELAMPSIESYAASSPQIFGGTGIAGFDPSEVSAQQQYLTQAAPQANQLAGQAVATQQQLLSPEFMLNPNQYVHAAADATTNRVTQNLNENILPQVRSGAISSGGQYTGGSTRQGVAEGLAIGKTNENLGDSLAQMYLANYQNGMQGMSNAVNNNPGVMGQLLFSPDIEAAVGGQKRAAEQAALDEEIRKFYATQDLDLNKSQQLLNLISGMPGGVGTSTVTGAQPQSNNMMQMLGMGMSGLSMLGGAGPMAMMK